jgi:hypothetical protein
MIKKLINYLKPNTMAKDLTLAELQAKIEALEAANEKAAAAADKKFTELAADLMKKTDDAIAQLKKDNAAAFKSLKEEAAKNGTFDASAFEERVAKIEKKIARVN